MRRQVHAAGLAAVLLLAPVVALILLGAANALNGAALPGLPDAGAFVRWGLPVTRAVRDLSMAVTVGVLAFVTVVASPEPGVAQGRLGERRARVLTVAAFAAGVWVWSGLSALVLTFADLAGTPPDVFELIGSVGYFVTDFDLGRSLLLNLLAGTVIAAGAVLARRLTTVAVLAVIAVLALWPLALTGHAAGALNHDVAVNSQAAHLVGISVWCGGLAAVLFTRGLQPVEIRRFSRLAGACFVLVAGSGVVAAVLRLQSWSSLNSTYAAVLVVKVVALCLLGVAGWWHRRRLIPAAATHKVRRLVVGELVVMAAAIGAAIALGRIPPPGEDRRLSTAESLLGHALPGPLGVREWFTSWRIDSLWTPLAVLSVILYLGAVVRLRRRGDRWPVSRTFAWCGGAALLIWATSGSPGVYGDVLFSMHMVQHMTIATAVPVLLVLGCPVTLALRALRHRGDGSRGAREWLLIVLHSRVARLLGNPLVAAPLFIVSLVAFYYSSLFELSLRTHTGHQLMILHYLASGYLFASVICGSDPGFRRPIYPLRMLLLMATFGFHAFFSISLMSSSTVLAADWFGSLGRTWGASLERDQYLGASLGWALGDYPLAMLVGGMIWGWVKSDHREARRLDRRADRDGDQDLQAYNEYLHTLARSAADREKETR